MFSFALVQQILKATFRLKIMMTICSLKQLKVKNFPPYKTCPLYIYQQHISQGMELKSDEYGPEGNTKPDLERIL